MNGDAYAPCAVEQRGLDTFIKDDCKLCHDGNIKTLDEAVRKIGKLQPNEEPADQLINDTICFLQTLAAAVRPVTSLLLTGYGESLTGSFSLSRSINA